MPDLMPQPKRSMIQHERSDKQNKFRVVSLRVLNFMVQSFLWIVVAFFTLLLLYAAAQRYI